ncbi:iron-sulfur cluster assembly scaffold protein [Salinarchaeum sp. IM2453]|uniref:iron-sulfur cluster assembly scaffold protein n=1 Tax=Salinarchaeum sp. IM2453 TaxID=2862870 RepID=UPI001C83312A|nr:iron-sulfur cluster assembly scaffold protein [Salinarchaeum sp. IM2453]QZA87552.1 iron-sulfur cluster assembly scaffold protein [Salinarchaeum sp. IM2453]
MSLGSDIYRQQILDHYKNPRNYGELEDPTYSHIGENPMCGDEIQVDVQIDETNGTIENIAFQGDGCAISLAAASLLSEELQGENIETLQEMDRDDIIDLLGVEISPMRVKCAVLAEKVLQDGYDIYLGEKNQTKTTTED